MADQKSKKKKFSGIKAGKDKKFTMPEKKPKKIVEYYYMTPTETNAKDLSLCVKAVPEDQVEVWTELNLMEVVMTSDSLIFQDAAECFIDPLDLEFLEQNQIKTKYQISFEVEDRGLVHRVMKEILEAKGGFVCSDTEDFQPIFTVDNIETL